MKSFLLRLMGGVFGGGAVRLEAPGSAHVGQSGGGPAVLAPESASSPAASGQSLKTTRKTAALMGVSARRPLISGSGDVVGFEFRISDDTLHRLRHHTDHKAQSAYVSAVLTSARLVEKSGRAGFVRLPADWFVHTVGGEEGCGIFVGLEPPSNETPDSGYLRALAQAVQRMRAAGAKVGWDMTSPHMARSVAGMTPDFLLLSQGVEPMSKRLDALKGLPAELSGLQIFATDISNVEDLEEALHRGTHYVCGELAPHGAASSPKEIQPVPPEVRRVSHLLKQLATGAETSVIAGEIKGDVGLSFRMLRLINSASFAQLNAGANIDQAVMMLGRNELYRWLSIMLLQYAGQRKVSSALQEVALWRSRLMELLAVEKKEESPGQFFTLGLSSMLGFILKLELPDVVSTLNLPEPARQALLEQTGHWHAYLQVAALIETKGLDEAGQLVAQFGGTERILALSDEAWAWAAEHADRKGERWASQAG